MKRVFVGFLLCILLFGGFFCVSMYRWLHRHTIVHGQDISLSIRESDDMYQIYASYDPEKTWHVQDYLDETLRSNHMFRNARMNGMIVLDDRMNFFIRAVPGKLVIKFDRDDNSEEAFHRIKEFGKGLKFRISSN
ncbi:hypothetical protein [Sediminibacterium soli]|uniref:hypothetical protein n=1 Tax=Sediminibacterium soli TaxID=2698829 RepID=UPI00137B9369|nr:hypothetical protein [Sediminibacterium soli]NCI47767.1 hypothetical protein [Sediminibacterium soli]